MKRRDFVRKGTAAATLPFWLQQCAPTWNESNYPVQLHSDHATGHTLMESLSWATSSEHVVDIAIVGGGLAGLSAAYQLRNSDFKLFELSDRLGGTSASAEHNGLFLSQGAHYDLAYPDYYGQEVIQMLHDLNIVTHEPWKSQWSFKDRQHVIPYLRRQQCYEDGIIRSDVIPDGAIKEEFYSIISPFLGSMAMPTRLIASDYYYLNNITFLDFLSEKMAIDAGMRRQLDYHMMDDYGGRADQVSALAGIHYFMCRPYLRQAVDLFSPPQGNAYFTERILNALPRDQIHTNHLVRKVEKGTNRFSIEVADVATRSIKRITAQKVIYAGQKHALEYIYPQEQHHFDMEQAPWMVINFVCDDDPNDYGYWQNEYLGENPAFLGFIDSSVQDPTMTMGKRIYTAYYCLVPSDREFLSTMEDHKHRVASETQGYIEEMLGRQIDVKSCLINVMGHAMPIPKPGYLFDEDRLAKTDLIYAGVDIGRLPLLFEAIDSGIMAARRALRTT